MNKICRDNDLCPKCFELVARKEITDNHPYGDTSAKEKSNKYYCPYCGWEG
jgi:predicted RNA-binding Zn-ribbon protein involved in translation (DUF1610 family)